MALLPALVFVLATRPLKTQIMKPAILLFLFDIALAKVSSLLLDVRRHLRLAARDTNADEAENTAIAERQDRLDDITSQMACIRLLAKVVT